MLQDRYNVVIINSAKLALNYLSKNKPDIILLDYQMPLYNGANLMNNGKCCNTVNVHNYDTGNQGNTVENSHDHFKSGNFPFLFRQHRIGNQNGHTDHGDHNMRGHAGGFEQKQQNADNQQCDAEGKDEIILVI